MSSRPEFEDVWLWIYTDCTGRRRTWPHLLTESTAQAQLMEATRITESHQERLREKLKASAPSRTIVVCGGRHFLDKLKVYSTLNIVLARKGITRITHTGATGVEALAVEWALDHGVQLQRCPVGETPDRVSMMRMFSDAAPMGMIVFPGGDRTAAMMREAHQHQVPVWAPYGVNGPIWRRPPPSSAQPGTAS